jgi:UDP-galactopyranose mutase
MRCCAEHEFITYVAKDGKFYHYPIHKDDIPRMPDRENIESELELVNGASGVRNFEEYWVMSVG